MRGQAGFFDMGEGLDKLSAKDNHLERLNAIVDFELFRPILGLAGSASDTDTIWTFREALTQAQIGGEPP